MTDLLAPRTLAGVRPVRARNKALEAKASLGALLTAGVVAGALVGSHLGASHGSASRDDQVRALTQQVAQLQATATTARSAADQARQLAGSQRGQAQGASTRAVSEAARAATADALTRTCRKALATQLAFEKQLLDLVDDGSLAAAAQLNTLDPNDPRTRACLTPPR